GYDQNLDVVNAQTGDLVARFPIGNAAYSMAISADGKRLAACTGDSVAQVFDVDGSSPDARRIDTGAEITMLAISGDGSRIITGGQNGAARVFDAVTRKALAQMDFPKPVLSVAIARDGRWAAAGSEDATARLI